VVGTCLGKSDAAGGDDHPSPHTSAPHDDACRIGHSLSSVGTVHTCFLLLVACPPCKCHMSH